MLEVDGVYLFFTQFFYHVLGRAWHGPEKTWDILLKKVMGCLA